jgi:2,5-diketo-D-gluconate reductase B
MLERETERADREARQRGRTGNGSGGLVRKGLPFAVAFAAGFVFGKRREGDGADSESFETEAGGLSEVASKVRERATPGATDEGESADAEGATDQPSSMGSVSGEAVREDEREGAESETESEPEGAQPAGTEAAGIDAEVADLSAPSAHGMPMLGLGTYQMEEYDECVKAVRQAIQMGYQHIDTAEGYDNEAAVGDAIVEAEIGREDLFLATKISPDNLDYDHVLTNAADSFDRLGVDYVDLLYVHWPTGEYEATDTLEAFAELRQEDLIGEIGVSNFTVEQLEEAIEVSEEPIFANQVEMHPLLPQQNLRQFCAQDDVDVELVAYSPIARGDVSDVDELQEVAEKHGATPAQVSLAWLREKEVTAIPKATGEDHLRENWLSLGLELDDEDMEKIDSIEERQRIVDPDEAPWNQ